VAVWDAPSACREGWFEPDLPEVQHNENNEVDRGTPPERSATYPFPNFSRGLLALVFSVCGITRSQGNLIVAAILTAGFCVDELRSMGHSSQTLVADTARLVAAMFPRKAQVGFTEQIAARRPMDAPGRRRHGRQFQQTILSVVDHVKLDMSNPHVRPHILFGTVEVPSHEPVKEFRQTRFRREYRRYTELVDFYLGGVQYTIGDYVIPKRGSRRCRDGRELVICRRIDKLRYRKATPYLNHDSPTRKLAAVTMHTSQRVRPVLQYQGPRTVTGSPEVLQEEDPELWYDVATIHQKLQAARPPHRYQAYGSDDTVPLVETPLDLGVPNMRPGQVAMFVSVFIDGFHGNAVNVSLKYDNLDGSARDSSDYVRPLFVCGKKIPLKGPNHALTMLCNEFDAFGPGTDGIVVWDVAKQEHRSVVLVPSFFVVDIAESYASMGILSNGTFCHHRHSYASKTDLCDPAYDPLDHTTARRAAQSNVAVQQMREELAWLEPTWLVDATNKASKAWKRARKKGQPPPANFRLSAAWHGVRQRYGQQHDATLRPWHASITRPVCANGLTPYEFAHLFYANFLPTIVKKFLVPAIKADPSASVLELKTRMDNLPWPSGHPAPKFWDGDKLELLSGNKAWEDNRLMGLAVFAVAGSVVKANTESAHILSFFRRAWLLVLRVVAGVSEDDMPATQAAGRKLLADGHTLLGAGFSTLPNTGGVMDFFARFLPIVGKGPLVSAQAFEASNKFHSRAIDKGGHSVAVLAMNAALPRLAVRHALQGGSWDDGGTRVRLGSRFLEMLSLQNTGKPHPLLASVGCAVSRPASHDTWGDAVPDGLDQPDTESPWRVHRYALGETRADGRKRTPVTLDMTEREFDLNDAGDAACYALWAQADSEASWDAAPDPRMKNLLSAFGTEVRKVRTLVRVTRGRQFTMESGASAWCHYPDELGSFNRVYVKIMAIYEVKGIDGRALVSFLPAWYEVPDAIARLGPARLRAVPLVPTPAVVTWHTWTKGDCVTAHPIRLVRDQVMVVHNCGPGCKIETRCSRHIDIGGAGDRYKRPADHLRCSACADCAREVPTVFHFHPPLLSRAGHFNEAAWDRDTYTVLGPDEGFWVRGVPLSPAAGQEE
jgi:hypothetical protein